MTKLIKGIHHVALKCTYPEQFEKTIGFYRDILGMEVVRTWGEGTESGIMLNTGSGLMEIFADSQGDKEQGAIRHVAFATDDVDACIKTVRDNGYEVTMEPNDLVIGSAIPFPVRIGFCIGPVGEEIEFFHEKN